MRKINFLAALLLFTVVSVFAQSNKEEVELMQSIFGMEKKAVVNEFIKLDGEKATAFWTLYDQYETARKTHGQKRINLLNTYTESYLELDDVKTEEIMKEMLALSTEYNKLITKYYKSIRKACGIKTAAQFYQLETYFQSIIRLTLMEQIPLIGELEAD